MKLISSVLRSSSVTAVLICLLMTTSSWAASEPALSAPARNSRAVLYDNGPLVTHPGGGAGGADASALQTSLGMNTIGFGAQFSYGNRMADDFEVTDASGWDITEITFFAYQTGSGPPSTITGVYYQIWDGPPNAGGTIIWGDLTTNRMTSTGWSNIYRVSDTNLTDTQRPIMTNVASGPGVMPQGTYWLDVTFDGSGSSGPWVPPITILGQTTTGNALQYTSSGWAAANDSGTLTPQGIPFIVEGIVNVNPTSTPPPTITPTPTPTGPLPTPTSTSLPVQAYGIHAPPGDNLVYWENLLNPDTWTVVGSVGGLTLFAGDFLNDDYSLMYAIDTTANQLYGIDTTTAAATLIGACPPQGGQIWTGLTGAADGTLYGVSTDSTTSYLYTINQGSAVAAVIGQITNVAGAIDVAINLWDEMYVHDIVSDSIYRVDPETGAGTLVGVTGFSANYAQGMDFDDNSGTLYLAAYNTSSGGELRSVNLGSGATTLIGAFPGAAEVDSLGIVGGGPPPPTNTPLPPTGTPGGPTRTPTQTPTGCRMLWDQPLSIANTNAYANQDFFPANDGYDIYIADDFQNAYEWEVAEIFINCNTWNPGTDLTCAASLNFEIYMDAGGVPDGDPRAGGNPPYWSASLDPTDPRITLEPGTSGFLTNVTLTLSSPISMPPGHWWLVWYPYMEMPVCGWAGRQVSQTVNNHPAVVMNPDGGFGFPANWTSVQDPSTWALIEQDFAFSLCGEAIGVPTDTPVPPTGTPVPPTATVPTGVPTSTAMPPTSTPIPPTPTVPTGVPTNTALPPTSTPVNPTHTPIPPTSTPGCTDLGCEVFMPKTHFTAGDDCYCKVYICNPDNRTYTGIPVFVILDVYGLYFFAPSFGEFDYYQMTIVPGLTTIDVLPSFIWPGGVGSASGIMWYAAMTDPGITELFGQLGTFMFGWS